MKEIGIKEIQKRLGMFSSGEEFLITKRGQPLCRVVPYDVGEVMECSKCGGSRDVREWFEDGEEYMVCKGCL